MRLASSLLELDVEPERGMTISSLRLAFYEAPNILWKRPYHRAPPASRVIGPAGNASIDTLHDLLVGGWFEMSPHAGLPGLLDGRETMLHGEAARLPWYVTRSEIDVVEALTRCVRYPLELRRRVTLNESRVGVTSTIVNIGVSPCSITHGEHPCFSREVFAAGSIDIKVRTARVLPPLDARSAVLVPGPFHWPEVRTKDGQSVDLSMIPSLADHSHDHIALELAAPELSITTNDGLRVTIQVNLEEHPYVLFWRNYQAPESPGLGRWDVFSLEPQSAPGRGVEEAVQAGETFLLHPDERVTYACAVTLAH